MKDQSLDIIENKSQWKSCDKQKEPTRGQEHEMLRETQEVKSMANYGMVFSSLLKIEL